MPDEEETHRIDVPDQVNKDVRSDHSILTEFVSKVAMFSSNF